MGNYLNPGSTMFWGSLRSQIYIDKSGLIRQMNTLLYTEQRYVCVSRPRRFGKSMAANMLAAYYDKENDTKELFAGLKISKDTSFDENINKYDVIKINMQEFLSATQSMDDMLKLLQKRILADLRNKYPEFVTEENLVFVMQDVFAKTNSPFIILIDEWDCLFREYETDIGWFRTVNLGIWYIRFTPPNLLWRQCCAINLVRTGIRRRLMKH